MSSTALLLLLRQLHLYSYRIVSSLICNLNVLVTPVESLSSEMFGRAAGAGSSVPIAVPVFGRDSYVRFFGIRRTSDLDSDVQVFGL